MLKLEAETQGSVGTSAPVSLLDWYDLDQELILVLERPDPSVDLHKYIEVKGDSLQEEEAKVSYWRIHVRSFTGSRQCNPVFRNNVALYVSANQGNVACPYKSKSKSICTGHTED